MGDGAEGTPPNQPNSGRRSAFFKIRVAVLLLVLGFVALFAWRDMARRRARNDWERTLRVAVVLLAPEPLSPSAGATLCGRLPALEARLSEQAQRLGAPIAHPFQFQCFGPAEVTRPTPVLGDSGFFELLKYSFELYRYARGVDGALGIDTSSFDTRVYVTVLPSADKPRLSVEGESQEGGSIGTVSVELDEGMVDLALMVVAHELFHTLGASDKYAADGSVRAPDGLAEPNRVPTYPQEFAEIMARNRPITAENAVAPESLAQFAVGPATAREIGWLH